MPIVGNPLHFQNICKTSKDTKYGGFLPPHLSQFGYSATIAGTDARCHSALDASWMINAPSWTHLNYAQGQNT